MVNKGGGIKIGDSGCAQAVSRAVRRL